MSSGTVKGLKQLTTSHTEGNSTVFIAEAVIRKKVNTMEIVLIEDAVQKGIADHDGTCEALPLVGQTDAYDNKLDPATLHKLPYYRFQSGTFGIVADPQPGDKGMAVFAKRDSVNVLVDTTEPVHPGSFREFDQADGIVINGVKGKEPVEYIYWDPDTKSVTVSTKESDVIISCRDSGNISITTNAGDVYIKATGTATVECPQIELVGNVHITGSLRVDGKTSGAGGGRFVTSNGIINESNGITDEDVTVKTHNHGGVETGGGNTAQPNPGT